MGNRSLSIYTGHLIEWSIIENETEENPISLVYQYWLDIHLSHTQYSRSSITTRSKWRYAIAAVERTLYLLVWVDRFYGLCLMGRVTNVVGAHHLKRTKQTFWQPLPLHTPLCTIQDEFSFAWHSLFSHSIQHRHRYVCRRSVLLTWRLFALSHWFLNCD